MIYARDTFADHSNNNNNYHDNHNDNNYNHNIYNKPLAICSQQQVQ